LKWKYNYPHKCSGSIVIHRGASDGKNQQRVMEIERHESKAITKRERAILNRATLLKKGIKIPNLELFMWT
jgi:uncharacterized protein (UPF0248 family)